MEDEKNLMDDSITDNSTQPENNEVEPKIDTTIKKVSSSKKKVRIIKIILSVVSIVLQVAFFLLIFLFVIVTIVSAIMTLVDNVSSKLDDLKEGIEETEEDINNLFNGAGEDLDSFDLLANMYGESKCSFLEPFNIDKNHPYVISQGIDSKNIYSIADGKVIYVNDSATSLSDNYDFKVNKCLCNGLICDNYDGNQIKLEFEVDGIPYFAIYSNLDEVLVKEGTSIKKGDLIATEGNTGCTNIRKLTFKIEDEKGNSYNPDGFMKNCSSMNNTYNSCDLKNININYDINGETKSVYFYEYIKQELYKEFKVAIDNEEVLKAGTVMLATKFLKENNYKIGEREFKLSNYQEIDISDVESKKLNRAMNDVLGQVLTYAGNFANIKFSNSCTRKESDKNANLIYNEFCIKTALNSKKTYEELLKIYFPQFNLSKNFCLDYANQLNDYKINNNKQILNKIIDKEELDFKLKTRIDKVEVNSRAATVEAARFLVLGFDYRIPYKNGGKYFELGFNSNWYSEGLDSSGFVSWALLNGGAKIAKSLNINELVNNTVGSIKIDQNIYNFYNQIQVGDIAYQSSKVGLIIGKSEGILYVAEVDSSKGLIVSKITSYGESASNYTNIYFADEYYQKSGILTNMW